MWASLLRGRLLTLRRVASVLCTRKYASKQIRCNAHMNELPIPCGPWEDYYNNRQAFYNRILAVGVLWCSLSFFLMVFSGSFYLNCAPPAIPGPASEMVDECEGAAPGDK